MRRTAASRRAWLAVGLAMAVGLVARGWGVDRLGIDHFDEGVYAFTGLAWADPSQPLDAYPDQILFSPPVYPALVALSYRLLGPAAEHAILVNVILGTLTVGVVGFLGMAWFGPTAGVVAAWILALDPLHLALSRSGLTDVTFLLLFVVAVGSFVRAAESGRWRWAIAAGVATGLAWNTKYHGWFALLVGAAAFIPGLWRERRQGLAHWIRITAPWGAAAVLAGLFYLPWAAYVHAVMGYGELAAYQGTNIDGTWFGNLWIQAGQQRFLESPFSRLAPAVAVLAASLVGRSVPRLTRGAFLLVCSLAVIGSLVGSAATSLVLLLGALAWHVRAAASPAVWMMMAWSALWIVSAPIYHPYARLVAPLWAVAALGAGLAAATLLKRTDPGGSGSEGAGRLVGALGVIAVGLVVNLQLWVGGGPWRPSDGARTAARQMEAVIPEGARVVVVGEPEVAFYLHVAGRPAFERAADPRVLAALEEPIYLVVGRYVRVAPVLREGILEDLAPRLELLGTYDLLPKDIRLLDDRPPARSRELLRSGGDDFELALYRLAARDPS